MNNELLLSLCIPTNGISEWVFPVLDSIYCQSVEESLYEVIVCDNGDNYEFNKKIQKYIEKHKNIIYRKTNAIQFSNQIEAFKLAQGKFIKFINHRAIMKNDSIKHLLRFISKNQEVMPTIFFTNGVLDLKEETVCESLGVFIESLSYYSSWSAGLGVWKKDFEKIPADITYNKLFPHTSILFHEIEKKEYIIDNKELFCELLTDETKKGRYNLFNAFAVEYVSIISDLYRENKISLSVFLNFKKEVLKFISELYWSYIIKKNKCSYDLSDYDKHISIYFSMKEVRIQLIKNIFYKIINRF